MVKDKPRRKIPYRHLILIALVVIIGAGWILRAQNHPREVIISILSSDSEDTFAQLETTARRNREGLQIWTNQSDFWEEGDFLSANFQEQGVKLELFIDDLPLPNEPFIFWDNGSFQDVTNAQGQLIGRYLWSPMSIGFSTEAISLGQHTLTLRITTTKGRILEKSWDFAINPRMPARQSMPVELMPDLLKLQLKPQPLPDEVLRANATTAYQEGWVGLESNEGLCVTLKQPDSFRFRIDDHTPDIVKRGTDWDGLFFCVDSDYLATGWHIAELYYAMNGGENTYRWAFEAK
jgi:hypothetical protein